AGFLAGALLERTLLGRALALHARAFLQLVAQSCEIAQVAQAFARHRPFAYQEPRAVPILGEHLRSARNELILVRVNARDAINSPSFFEPRCLELGDVSK